VKFIESSGMYCRVVNYMLTDVSEVRTASIIRVMRSESVTPWWWRQYAPLKRGSTSTWLHSNTSQKTLNFILAAMRTWNLTSNLSVQCLWATDNFCSHDWWYTDNTKDRSTVYKDKDRQMHTFPKSLQISVIIHDVKFGQKLHSVTPQWQLNNTHAYRQVQWN
jgi:hypothetical protein